MKKTRDFYHSAGDPPAKRSGLDAALELFVRDGVSATSIRDIAGRTGYTNPAIFKHFESKEALAGYLFERCYCWIGSAIAAATSREKPFAQQMRETLACYLGLMDENLEATLYVQENLRRFWNQMPPVVRSQSLLSRMRNLIRTGVKEGVVSGDQDPNLLAAAIIGTLGQVARMRYLGEFPGRATTYVEALDKLVGRMSRG